MNKRIILLLVIVLVVHNLYGLDFQPTGEELGFYFTPEYQRALNFCWDISTVASITFNEKYTAMGGLALGGSGKVFDMKLYTGLEAAMPVDIPLYVSLNYNYYGMPEYEYHVYSLLPLVSFKWQVAGFSIGPNFRFGHFFGEQAVFEPIILFSGYFHFIDNDVFRLGIKAANFNDFVYGNFGSYYFTFCSLIRLNRNMSLINDVEFHQAGSVGLTSNFYGVVYRGGVLFSW